MIYQLLPTLYSEILKKTKSSLKFFIKTKAKPKYTLNSNTQQVNIKQTSKENS